MKCIVCNEVLRDFKVFSGYDKRPISTCCSCLEKYAVKDDGFVVELTD